MTYAQGTDISHWNAFKPGKDFTIIKSTEGFSSVDPEFAARWKLLAGKIRGAYCFLEVGDGSNQADFFLSIVKPVAGDILALDYEAAGLGYAQANDWVARVKSLHPDNKVVVYGHPTDVNQINADKWVALWGNTVPSPPWTFWQYGSVGVDADKFNGTASELADYVGGNMADTYGDMLAKAGLGIGDAAGNENWETGRRFFARGILTTDPLYVARAGSVDFVNGYEWLRDHPGDGSGGGLTPHTHAVAGDTSLPNP